jgi:hypothetical protein
MCQQQPQYPCRDWYARPNARIITPVSTLRGISMTNGISQSWNHNLRLLYALACPDKDIDTAIRRCETS